MKCGVTMSTTKRRETELDILRFLAMLCVITIHVCAGTMDELPSKSFNFIVINSLFSIITWCVPLLTFIVYGISLLVTIVIRKIPFIGKNIT